MNVHLNDLCKHTWWMFISMAYANAVGRAFLLSYFSELITSWALGDDKPSLSWIFFMVLVMLFKYEKTITRYSNSRISVKFVKAPCMTPNNIIYILMFTCCEESLTNRANTVASNRISLHLDHYYLNKIQGQILLLLWISWTKWIHTKLSISTNQF